MNGTYGSIVHKTCIAFLNVYQNSSSWQYLPKYIEFQIWINYLEVFSVFPGLLEEKNPSEAMCCEYLTVDVIATEVVECLLGKAAIQSKATDADWDGR